MAKEASKSETKAENKELVKQASVADLWPIATATTAAVAPSIDGIEETEFAGNQIGAVTLYQGTSTEEAAYGQHKRGDFVDTMTRESLGPTIRVMVVGGWVSYMNWPKDSRLPVYVHTSRKDVPPEDLKWGENNEPPVAATIVNTVVLVEGRTRPYLLQFKKTSLGAFGNRRTGMNTYIKTYGNAVFELSSKDDTNSLKQVYKRMTSRFVRVATSDESALIALCNNAMKSGLRKTAEAVAQEQYKADASDREGVANERESESDLPV